MTRFEKEMKKLFPGIDFSEDMYGNKKAWCIPEESLIVFNSPGLTEILQYQRNGKQRDVTNDYPRISAPYLVFLCGGNEDRAREILKAQSF